jgi:uncharacterized Tic20 family protein
MDQTNQQIRDERMWGMFCHLSAFAGYIIPFGSIIGPLIIWSLKKDEFPFVNDQGKEALNFQISMTIYFIISAFLIIIVIGIALLVALGIFQLIMIVIASIKANNGETFRYPFAIRFLS